MNFKKNVSFLLVCFLFFSCSNLKKEEDRMSFVVNEDIAWKTMVKVFKAYPLKTIDPHLAYIETEEMKGDRFWKAPHEEDQNFYGYSYIIKAHLNYKEPISTVTISKKIYRQKGFISKKEELPSDYLEETALFYHILRELELKKKLNISS